MGVSSKSRQYTSCCLDRLPVGWSRLPRFCRLVTLGRLVAAAAAPLGLALLLVQWINDVTGINYLIVRSFQELSGATTPDCGGRITS